MTEPEPLTEKKLENLEAVVNNDFSPVEYLSIDPGKSNGICGYDVKFYLQFMKTIASTDIVLFLQQFKKVKKCIMEGYKIYPNKANQHIYSDLETPRVIGRVESWAENNSIELIIQPASIKPTGYKWIGEKPLPKSNPKNHPLDAHVHFIYWAVRNGHIKAEGLLKR